MARWNVGCHCLLWSLGAQRLDLPLQPYPCHPLPPRWLAYVLLLLLQLLVCLFTLLGLAKQSKWLVIM